MTKLDLKVFLERTLIRYLIPLFPPWSKLVVFWCWSRRGAPTLTNRGRGGLSIVRAGDFEGENVTFWAILGHFGPF